jgi:hypothetical protein
LITCLKLANRTDDYITKLTRKSGQSTDNVGTKSENVLLEEIRLEEIRLEQKREKDIKKYSVFQPPDIVDIKNYISEMGYSVDPMKFYNHYESNGWRVGKNKMKSWQAAVRTWKIYKDKGEFK